MLRYTTIRGPRYLPLTPTEVKQWIYRHPTFTDDDDRISWLIASATEAIQLETGAMVCNQRIKWHPWRFGSQNPEVCAGREMYMPFGNNSEIVVMYVDSDGVTQTMPATDYRVIESENSNYILALEFEKDWPTDIDGTAIDSISITFDCGWHVGDIWTASTSYNIGDIMLPTSQKRLGLAYECQFAGTSGTAEPVLTTEIGAAYPEGPDTLVWECIGKTIPGDIRSAMFAYCGEKMRETGMYKEYPNLNLLPEAWKTIVGNRRLYFG